MVARVLFPWLPPWRNTIASPPTGDLKGNKCRTPPLIHHPRPYGSPGILPDFPASVDAYEGRSIGAVRDKSAPTGWSGYFVKVHDRPSLDVPLPK